MNPLTTIRSSFLPVLLAFHAANSQERGVLVVSSHPDSASVVLDGAAIPERQKTPYRNESMIPGKHAVVLRSANPAHVAGRYDVDIPAGKTIAIDHVFAYRTKAYDIEALSIAPWTLGVDMGVDWRTYLGFSEASTPTKADATKPDLGSEYPSDSLPRSLRVPLTFRVGLPGGVETRFSVPFAGRTEQDGSGGFGLGDVTLGAKWTCAPINSAIDAQWKFGNAAASRMGERSNSLELSVITNQKWKIVDALGQIGWRGVFENLDDDALSPGDEFFARARGGVLLADRFLPAIGLQALYKLPSTQGDFESDPAFHLTATPGLVVYGGRHFDFEVGVPLRLLASNAETFWGLQASMSIRMGFAGGAASDADKSASKQISNRVYSDPRRTVPLSAPAHVLMDAREVSNAEYRQFCDKTAREYPRDPDFTGMPNYFTDPAFADFPVVNVSLEDARAYATWVGKRLPTVDEWKREFQGATIPPSAVACGLEVPEKVDSRVQGAGYRNFVGNVAEWVVNDRTTGSAAYIAGGFFTLPRERCLDKSRWIDVASPMGARYIGIRLVGETR